MCGRVTLFIGNGVTQTRLIRTIPEIHIAVPSEIDRKGLRVALSSWLDEDQRKCAISVWNRARKELDDTSKLKLGGIFICPR